MVGHQHQQQACWASVSHFKRSSTLQSALCTAAERCYFIYVKFVYDKVSANVMISVQKMGESESGQIVF